MKKDQCQELPLSQRFTLTLKEASQYFHIGEKKLRRMAAEDPGAGFLIHNGRKVLISGKNLNSFFARPRVFNKS